MPGFIKIYGARLLDSSLYEEDPETRLVFISMLAAADENGIVDLHDTRSMARRFNLDPDVVAAAVAVLEAPDPRSRSKEHDGRRVARVDGGGWLILNHANYRAMQTRRQTQVAEAQRRFREKRKEEVIASNQVITKAEAKAKAKAEAKAEREREPVTSPDGSWTALRARMIEMGHPTRPSQKVTLPAGAPQAWATIWRDYGGLRGVLDQMERFHAHLTRGKGDPTWWSGKVFTHAAFARLVADCDEADAAVTLEVSPGRRLDYSR